MAVEPSSGLLAPAAQAAGLEEIVGAKESPFLQLEGAALATSPDGLLTLMKVADPAHATWLATGLQPDGYIAAGAPARVSVFAPKSSTAHALQVTLTLAPVPAPDANTEVTVALGPAHRRVALTGEGSPRRVTLLACFAPGQAAVAGTLTPTHVATLGERQVAGALQAVAVSPLTATASGC